MKAPTSTEAELLLRWLAALAVLSAVVSSLLPLGRAPGGGPGGGPIGGPPAA